MKLGVDPGHGMSNRMPNVFDPGAVAAGCTEAEVVLGYALALEREAMARGWDVVMTRSDQHQEMPLAERVPMVTERRCNALVSLHCNAATTETATGTETLFRNSDGLARRLQKAVVAVLGLRDRGAKLRNDLAVLRFDRPCALIELGFITNPYDRSVLLADDAPERVAIAICGALEGVS